jgi:hypothetical protein
MLNAADCVNVGERAVSLSPLPYPINWMRGGKRGGPPIVTLAALTVKEPDLVITSTLRAELTTVEPSEPKEPKK